MKGRKMPWTQEAGAPLTYRTVREIVKEAYDLIKKSNDRRSQKTDIKGTKPTACLPLLDMAWAPILNGTAASAATCNLIPPP
jgi:hypothetical protein